MARCRIEEALPGLLLYGCFLSLRSGGSKDRLKFVLTGQGWVYRPLLWLILALVHRVVDCLSKLALFTLLLLYIFLPIDALVDRQVWLSKGRARPRLP